jgi:hypothetical protein
MRRKMVKYGGLHATISTSFARPLPFHSYKTSLQAPVQLPLLESQRDQEKQECRCGWHDPIGTHLFAIPSQGGCDSLVIDASGFWASVLLYGSLYYS